MTPINLAYDDPGFDDLPTTPAMDASLQMPVQLRYGQQAVAGPEAAALQTPAIEGPLVALNTPALEFAPAQLVDSLLGSGWYDEWKYLDFETATQRSRTIVNRKRFEKFGEMGATNRLFWDMQVLQSIAFDYGEQMNLIAGGQSVDLARVGQLHDIYTLAVDQVRLDNDALDQAFDRGLCAIIILTLELASMKLEATRALERIRMLERALQQARKERIEAWVQAVIDTSLAVVTIVTPHFGLLTRAGILLAQSLLDQALGPSTSKPATAGAKASQVASQVGDALSELERLRKETRTIAKGAGMVATVTGFAFDANEVLIGHKNVEKLMAEAMKAYDSLLVITTRNKARFNQLLTVFQEWEVAIQDSRMQADLVRQALEEDMKVMRYTIKR